MRPMPRFTLIATCAVAALTIGWASAAFAYTTKSAACSTCHGTSAAVTVEATQTANDGANATYRVTVSNPYGVAGWAVIANGVNIVRDRSATGTFRVAVGGTYTVWGVSNGAAGEGGGRSSDKPGRTAARTSSASGRAPSTASASGQPPAPPAPPVEPPAPPAAPFARRAPRTAGSVRRDHTRLACSRSTSSAMVGASATR